MSELFEVVKKQTDYKSPDGAPVLDLQLNESDFQDAPYIPDEPVNLGTSDPIINNGTPREVAPEKENVFDPDFTTDIVIDTIDTVQHTLFLALNNRKQKNKRFKDRDEYLEAVKLSYLTQSELQGLENYEEKKILVEKLKEFQDIMVKINENLNFAPDEKERLKKPVYELVKRNNFDIPPGMALALVSIDIFSSRLVDLMMD